MRPYGRTNQRVQSLSLGQRPPRGVSGRARRWPIVSEPNRPVKSAHAEPRRNLPAIGALSTLPRARSLIERHGRAAVIASLRDVLGELRRTTGQGALGDSAEHVLSIVEARLSLTMSLTLLPMLNATGIVIHTNVGRAPLANEARAAVALAAEGYSNLEIDLETGKRRSRQVHVEKLLTDITGAEAALAVNNCAGAVLVTLAALGAGGGMELEAGRAGDAGVGGVGRRAQRIDGGAIERRDGSVIGRAGEIAERAGAQIGRGGVARRGGASQCRSYYNRPKRQSG